MSGFAIDPDTGDLAISAGSIGTVSGLEETRQRLTSRLEVAKGEWYFDPNYGMDWHDKIFGKKRLNEANAELVRVILETPKVIELLEPIIYDFDDSLRILGAIIKVRAEDGDLEVSI